MHADIIKIIEDGVNAPSGENCQPWKFRVQGNTVSVINIPEADQSLYNSKQKASYIAHGALIETMSISAREYGYTSRVTLFPNNIDDTHVADIVFKKTKVLKSDLYSVIRTRCTNRKKFSGEQLQDMHKSVLHRASGGLYDNRLILIDDVPIIKKIGKALGVHEQILFENKDMHTFFYDHVIWNKKDEEKAGGLYIETLELKAYEKSAVKLFQSWRFLTVIAKFFPITKMIGKENGQKCATSGTLGAFVMANSTKEDYVNVGRSIQRLWLTATKLDLALQPCNGVIYLMEYICDYRRSAFSKKHLKLLEHACKDIVQGFGNMDGHIAFIFRIGKATPPSAHAKRLKPKIEYLDYSQL